MSQSSESKIDRLRKRLNSQNQPDREHDPSRMSSADGSNLRRRWEHDDPADNGGESNSGGGSFLNKLLIFSGIFFILALGFAIFSLGFGGNGVSPNNVAIEVDGPTSVSAGDSVTFNINVTNNNEVQLREAELVVTYPVGTRQPSNTGNELHRVRENVGTIMPGQTIDYTTRASLYGEQDEEKSISIQLEYQVEDSNAIFSADATHEVDIAEAPISITVDSPSEVNTNEPITLELTVSGNTSRTLNDVLLVANYPFGFTVQDVTPNPSYRQFVWSLGDVTAGTEETIEITGAFTDRNVSDEQSFQFNAGTARVGDSTEIGTLFASQNITMQIEEPFINIDLDLNPRQDNSGNSLSVTGNLNWRSNLDTIVRGGEVTVGLDGEGIDFDSVDSEDGLYRSSEQAISWNARTNSELEDISPGDNGSLRFTFDTNNLQTLAEVTENPVANISVNMQAQTPDSSSLPNPITASLEETLRLPSVIRMTADTLYDDGPFTNSGPVPPEAGEATTYTLHLAIDNTTNDITNASFQAALPAYVELAGDPSPSSSDISYNDISGRISWDIGTISAGAGYNQAPKEIFIPIEVLPSQTQIGEVLQLLQDMSVTGTDSFTNESIQLNDIEAPTTVRDDLRAGNNSGRVDG